MRTRIPPWSRPIRIYSPDQRIIPYEVMRWFMQHGADLGGDLVGELGSECSQALVGMGQSRLRGAKMRYQTAEL